ncbi:MAG: hypothetical protein EA351_06310 [Gemmatimonadales bacterium]|nr:MAG: hypothetical protein EA351_06310 [Gemmatimonadales bacterium]
MIRLPGALLRHPAALRCASLVACAVAAAVPALAMPLQAQSSGGEHAAPMVVELPTSTRALGLGGAFHGGQRESDAIFASPGHLTNPTGMEAAFQEWGSGGTLLQMTGGVEWWSGGVALGVRALGYGPSFRGSSDSEEGTRGSGWDGSGSDGSESDGAGPGWLSDDVSELQFAVGYGRVAWGFRLGAVGSMLQFRTGGRDETTGALGLGAARSVGPVVLSASALNLGGGLETPPLAGDIDLADMTPTALSLSREIALGAASRTYPLGPLDVGAAARLSFHEGGATTYGGGLEVSYWPIQGRTFTVRVGARDAHDGSNLRWWTAGAGFRGDRLGLDYALMPFEGGTVSHRIGLIFR